MKKFLIAAAGLVALAAPALAADMAPAPRAYTKAPMIAPVMTYDWSGIYVGGQIGGIWNTTNGVFYNFPGFNWHTNSQSQGLGGGFVGIQKEYNNFVFGLEGGWDGTFGNGFGSTIGGGAGAPCGFVAVTESCQARIRDIGYVGGKLGYAFNRWMVYGTGGYARADINSQGIINATGVVFSQASAAHDGWYAGVGIDYAVLDNLILGVDYKHYEFNAANQNCAVCLAGIVDYRNFSASADSVMGRVSYKFNWGGPVVAKY